MLFYFHIKINDNDIFINLSWNPVYQIFPNSYIFYMTSLRLNKTLYTYEIKRMTMSTTSINMTQVRL